jgi:hypothetical protein
MGQATMKKNMGARREITVDGVLRTYRLNKEIAIEAAETPGDSFNLY